jgi:ElaB/YqjD/DUF883 family membrane-anchored ribosome-binding protein
MENSQTETAGNELRSLTDEIHHGIRGGKYTWREIQEAVMEQTRETAAHTEQ